jgi:hypothetical protein
MRPCPDRVRKKVGKKVPKTVNFNPYISTPMQTTNTQELQSSSALFEDTIQEDLDTLLEEEEKGLSPKAASQHDEQCQLDAPPKEEDTLGHLLESEEHVMSGVVKSEVTPEKSPYHKLLSSGGFFTSGPTPAPYLWTIGSPPPDSLLAAAKETLGVRAPCSACMHTSSFQLLQGCFFLPSSFCDTLPFILLASPPHTPNTRPSLPAGV